MQNAADQRALEEWKPGPSTPADPGWEDSAIVVSATSYLEAWRRKNYGQLTSFLQSTARNRLGKTAPGEMRSRYQEYVLDGYELVRIEHLAPALAVAHYRLTLGGQVHVIDDRWNYQGKDGRSTIDGQPGDRGSGSLTTARSGDSATEINER